MLDDDEARGLRRAEALIELRRFRDAIPVLQRVVASEPSDAEGWCYLSLCQRESGLAGPSLRSAERAVAADPEDEWAHRERAHALYLCGRLEEAVEAARTSAKLDPWSLYALMYLAWFSGLAGRRRDALAAAEKAIELDPEDASGWFAKGWSLQALGDWLDAEQPLRKAIELDPEESMWHNNLGYVLLAQHRFHEAVACFRTALRVDPENRFAKRNLGIALRWLGDDLGVQLSEEVLRAELREADSGLRADSRDAESQRLRTQALLGLRRWDEAVNSARVAVELDPDSPTVWRDLASFLVTIDSTQARHALDRAWELDSESAAALFYRAWASVRLGGGADVLGLVEGALERNPEDARLFEPMGDASMAVGDFAGTEYWYRRSLQRYPMRCCAAVGLSVCLLRQGRIPEGRERLVEAWKMNPACDELRIAREQLAEAQ